MNTVFDQQTQLIYSKIQSNSSFQFSAESIIVHERRSAVLKIQDGSLCGHLHLAPDTSIIISPTSSSYTVGANKTQYPHIVPALPPGSAGTLYPHYPPGRPIRGQEIYDNQSLSAMGAVRVQCTRTAPRPGGSAGTMCGGGAGTLRGYCVLFAPTVSCPAGLLFCYPC